MVELDTITGVKNISSLPTWSGFDQIDIDSKSVSDLVAAGSDKWTRYPGAIGAFIAEMDYGMAPCIEDAINSAVQSGALGYISDPWKSRVATACAQWHRKRFGWEIAEKYIRVVPDVVEAYEVFLRSHAGAGNTIVVPTPAYMPFLSVPRLFGVEVREVPMLRGNKEWHYDLDAFESTFKDGAKAFVLCNPHNPIGKVATKSELLELSELFEAYGVKVFSDEIHSAFTFGDKDHIPFATVSEITARQAVTATSASKAFNIAGTKCAQLIFSNDRDLEEWLDTGEWSEHQTSTVGAAATVAAYSYGGEWLNGAMEYLQRNLDLVTQEMAGRLSAVGYIEPEGTYIAWLDFSSLGIARPAEYFLQRANVALTEGIECGEVGVGCARMNFAMPYPLLQECLDRMYDALRTDGLI